MSKPESVPHQSARQARSRWIRFALTALNVALFVFFAHWLIRNISLHVFAEYFSVIPAWAILGSVLINFGALILYGLRMKFILHERYWISFSVINIGYGLNTIIPLRLGEAVKIVMAHRLYGIPAMRLVAASFLEKLVDLFKLLVLGIILVAFAAGRFINAGLLVTPFVLIVGALGAVFIFRLVVFHIDKIFPAGSRLRRILLEVHKHTTEYPLARILSVTVVIWSLNVLLMYFSFNTYLGNIEFTLWDSIALLLLLAMAIAMPSAPASIGLFEATIVAYLTQFLAVNNEAALAAAVVFHLAISVPQLAYLGITLLQHRMRAASKLPGL